MGQYQGWIMPDGLFDKRDFKLGCPASLTHFASKVPCLAKGMLNRGYSTACHNALVEQDRLRSFAALVQWSLSFKRFRREIPSQPSRSALLIASLPKLREPAFLLFCPEGPLVGPLRLDHLVPKCGEHASYDQAD